MAFRFFQRTFPSANMILVEGTRPLLIDSGFGSDIDDTVALLKRAGVDPRDLQMVANTHHHCDHVGGNHGLQTRYGVQIGAQRWEGTMVNRRDREACSAEWLVQPIQPYTVDVFLDDGDVIDTGDVQVQVIHTPGHTLGHLCYYADGVLIAGDAFHGDDVAWINVFREGGGAIYRLLESLDRLARLPLKRSYSGHGAACDQPLAAIDAARRRYDKWLDDPQKIGWHACKRIFTYALMLYDGMTETECRAYLLRAGWFLDYSRHIFDTEPVDFVAPMLDELIRSGAARWHDGKLLPNAAYDPPPPGWLDAIKPPRWWNAP